MTDKTNARPRGTSSAGLSWAQRGKIVARHIAERLVDRGEAAMASALARLAFRRKRELSRRAKLRPEEHERWFTPDEASVAASLAALIVPSDELGPGASEAKVVSVLERVVGSPGGRQKLYAEGLLAVDEWALRTYRRRFQNLQPHEQATLLDWAERLQAEWTRPVPLAGKILRKAAIVYRKWHCPFVELFPQLRRDVLTAFYTSPVSWQWLGYDGPPMPRGYPDLRKRESATA